MPENASIRLVGTIKIGIPIGSPISYDATCLLMNEILTTAQESYDIQNLRKYVDDIFLFVPANSLPFLDMLVTKHCGSITTKWYRNPIFSGRISNQIVDFFIFHTNIFLKPDNILARTNLKMKEKIMIDSSGVIGGKCFVVE